MEIAVTTLKNSPQTTTNLRRRYRLATWIGGSVVCYAWTYFFGLHLGWSSADYLRGLLQGVDMAHGNVLLNHWYSGTDSYWAVDSVFMMLGVLAIGAKIVVAHVVAAFVWTCVIIISCVAATTGLRQASAIVASAAVVITLGLPCALLARYLSATSDHVTTCLVALLAFVGLRNNRFGWGWIAAIFLLSAGLLSDPLIVAYALVPIFLVGVLDSVRARQWVDGLPLCAASVSAPVLALIARKVAEYFGTYQLSPGSRIVSSAARLDNLHALFPSAFSLLGFGGSFSDNRIPWELGIFRISGVVVLGAGFLVGLACLFLGVVSGQPRIDVQGMRERSRSSFRLNDLLVLGVLGDAATYVGLSADATGLRYLTAGIVFSAILGAMLLGQIVMIPASHESRRIGTAIAIIVVSANAACAGIFLSHPGPVSPYPRLSAFLVSHDLTRGLGDYWTAAPVTLYSQEKVTVRQVLPTFQGGIGPYLWIDKGTWFRGKFQFLVLDVHQFESHLIRSAPRFPFAPVAHFYREGPYRIIVWRRPHTLEFLAGV